ncbi:MAG: winged helix-turn-helix domain-containing protein [Candidatus Bathyarchaeota archaeon]|nr:winged helix-turn-helix domain-containing protein [Candidatus Bathyarchaeota archaeon]
MPAGKEEIYSIMFSSLKHPARRKILRVLADKPMTFSEMLEILGISSSNLTYHLENLGELVSKDENGVYRLSTFGQASVSTMKVVEEAPEVQPKKGNRAKRRWQMITAAVLIGLIVCASLAAVEFVSLNQVNGELIKLQSDYTQLLAWTSTTDDAISFLHDVVQLDTSKYQATLLSRTIESRKDLGGIPEEVMRYSLVGTDDSGAVSKLSVYFRFRNCEFSRYQLTVEEGSPIYAEPQSPFVLDAAKNVVDRLQAYESGSYLANMSQLMSLASTSNTSDGIEIKVGNIKVNATVTGDNAEVLMEYTENGVDFSPKSVEVIFKNNILTELTDGWRLFGVGSTGVTVSSDRAVTLAKNALGGFQWASGGVVVSSFEYNPDPASVVFHPNTKDGLTLYPQWIVTFYLNKVYAGGVYMISVAIWADTGEVAGTPQPLNSPQTFNL